jgi:hypothetical protein
MPRGCARIQAGLDVLFEHYSGPLFGAMVELSRAARADPVLGEVVGTEERKMSGGLFDGLSRARRSIPVCSPAHAVRP